jgi:hypothetical protein
MLILLGGDVQVIICVFPSTTCRQCQHIQTFKLPLLGFYAIVSAWIGLVRLRGLTPAHTHTLPVYTEVASVVNAHI